MSSIVESVGDGAVSVDGAGGAAGGASVGKIGVAHANVVVECGMIVDGESKLHGVVDAGATLCETGLAPHPGVGSHS
jgi:hypothetical protein